MAEKPDLTLYLDIRDILVAMRLEDDAELTAMFEMKRIDRWMSRLGPDVERLWQRLRAEEP